MRYRSWVFYMLVWHIFIWAGLAYLVFWKGDSAWLLILCAVLTTNSNTPWKINVPVESFWVWSLWNEIKSEHPGRTFGFSHCNGLAVLAKSDRGLRAIQAVIA
jgi:hypothetical protein